MPPRFSIITVCYQAAPLLETTFISIFSQTFKDYEYIVVDGGSKDHTPLLLEKYKAHISKVISEPDKGLYDAMNKGLALATGTYVWFINAGDSLYASDTLEQLHTAARDADILAGEVVLVNEAGQALGTRSELTTQRLPRHLTWKSMRYGMVVSHQGFIPKRALCPTYVLGNLSADIDWVIHVLKKSRQTRVVGFPVARYLTGGLSKKRHADGLKGRYAILRTHFGWFPNLWAHGFILVRGLWWKWKRRGKPSY